MAKTKHILINVKRTASGRKNKNESFMLPKDIRPLIMTLNYCLEEIIGGWLNAVEIRDISHTNKGYMKIKEA